MKTEKFEMIAKTFQGLEDVLAQEVIAIGGEEVEIGKRMVSFIGNKEMMYKANLHLRTALRVLKPIFSFTASSTDEVYEIMKSFKWEDYLTAEQTFAIDSVVFSDNFRHSKFVTYRAKDAIADYFQAKFEKRPSVRITNPDISLNLHISNNQCTLSLDSSGESLHKRGYRVEQTDAPLNEVLAAGMILKTGWKGDKNFVDPMCGSGTLLIEAALIATNTPPGIYRQGFAFEKWKDYDEELFDNIYNDEGNEKEFDFKIYGSDVSPKAIATAEENIKSAGLSRFITLKTLPLQQYTKAPDNAILIMNPPYGERISARDILSLYEMIGSTLKHVFKGYEAWVLSYHEECFDKIGLKPSEKFDLMNGGLDCQFRKYEIFEGKLKDFKEEGGQFEKLESFEIDSDNREKRQIRKDRFTGSDRSSSGPKRYGDRKEYRSGESKGRRENTFRKSREEGGDAGFERKPRFDGDSDRKPRFDRESGDRKPRFGGDSDRKPRFGGDSDRPSRFGGDSDRKPRFGGDSDRKPRFGGDSDRKPRFGGDSDRKPRFGGDSDRKPRFGGDSDRKPRFGGDSDRKPRFGGDSDRKPRFGGDSDRKPRFGGDNDRPSRFGGEGDRKPRFGGDNDRPSRFGGEGDRKPRFEDRSNNGMGSGNFRRNNEGRLEQRSEGEYKPRGERKFNPDHKGYHERQRDQNNESND